MKKNKVTVATKTITEPSVVTKPDLVSAGIFCAKCGYLKTKQSDLIDNKCPKCETVPMKY